MFVGLIIVGIVASKELHWIGFLIGGGLFFFCLSAATGLLQTVRLHTNLSYLFLVRINADSFICSTSSKATCLALWILKPSSSSSSQSGVSSFLSLSGTGEPTMVFLRSTPLRVLLLPALVRFSVLSSSGKATRLGNGKVCRFLLDRWEMKGKELFWIYFPGNAAVLFGKVMERSIVKGCGKKIKNVTFDEHVSVCSWK